MEITGYFSSLIRQKQQLKITVIYRNPISFRSLSLTFLPAMELWLVPSVYTGREGSSNTAAPTSSCCPIYTHTHIHIHPLLLLGFEVSWALQSFHKHLHYWHSLASGRISSRHFSICVCPVGWAHAG